MCIRDSLHLVYKAIQGRFCPNGKRIPSTIPLLLRYVDQVAQYYPHREIEQREDCKEQENEETGVGKTLRKEERAEDNRSADEIPLSRVEHMPLEGGIGNRAVEPYCGEGADEDEKRITEEVTV